MHLSINVTDPGRTREFRGQQIREGALPHAA